MNRHSAYNLLVIGAFLWCSMIILPALLQLAGLSASSFVDIIYKSFSTICHQYDSRSIHLFGYKLAVCTRCSAIYFGFFLGLYLQRYWSPKSSIPSKLLWFFALAPMLVDVVLDVLALHASTFMTRIVTGGIFGLISAFLITPLFTEAWSEILQRVHNFKERSYATKA